MCASSALEKLLIVHNVANPRMTAPDIGSDPDPVDVLFIAMALASPSIVNPILDGWSQLFQRKHCCLPLQGAGPRKLRHTRFSQISNNQTRARVRKEEIIVKIRAKQPRGNARICAIAESFDTLRDCKSRDMDVSIQRIK
jgi:hypothetical protein